MEDAETALYDLTSGDEGDMAGNGGSNSNTSNRNSNSASNSISNSISNSNDGLTADSGAPMLNEALQKVCVFACFCGFDFFLYVVLTQLYKHTHTLYTQTHIIHTHTHLYRT